MTDWYGKNQLKLNTDKSEAIIFLTSKQLNDLPSDISVTIGGHRVVSRPSVRNLGVIHDSGLTMQAQVAQIAKSCYHQICNIGHQASLMMRAKPWCTHSSLHASTTRIRCYAAAFATCANCAARHVCHTRKYDHITAVLQHLYWLLYNARHTKCLCMLIR